MANIAKIDAGEFPTLYGEKTRPTEEVTDKKTLDLEGQVFENYSPKPGMKYRFTSYEDAYVRSQLVNENGKGKQFLLLCEMSSDGKNWRTGVINLNSFAKRDINNVPCHPTWYALGNIGARLRRLCEIGQIEVGTTEHAIQVPEFDGGRPLKVIAKNPDGSPNVYQEIYSGLYGWGSLPY